MAEFVPIPPHIDDVSPELHVVDAPISILSFNALAQCLIRSNLYPYAGKNAVKWKQRHKLLGNMYLGDICSFQEVDNYENFWQKMLESRGYASIHLTHANRRHGPCIAWNKQKFELVDHAEVDFSGFFKQHSEMPELEADELDRQENVAQMVALRWIGTNHGLVVLDTHLFWHPMYNYVRMRQMICCIQSVVKFNQFEGWPMLITGDLNMNPNHIVYTLMTRRDWNPDTVDIDELMTPRDHFKPGSSKLILDEEHVEDYRRITKDEDLERVKAARYWLRVFHELPVLYSVNDCYTDVVGSSSLNSVKRSGPNAVADLCEYGPDWTGEPPYTNAWPLFTGTLDYILLVGMKWGADVDVGLTRNALLKVPDVESILPALVRFYQHTFTFYSHHQHIHLITCLLAHRSPYI